MSSAPENQTVTRRRVFYIPGYDPMPPRRYRELYRSEGEAQARISGYDLALVPREVPPDGFGWGVQAQIDGAEVRSEIDVLVWSDIVQASMPDSIPATYGQLIRTAWIYISTGALWRLMRLRKGPIIAALYPVAMLLGQALLAGLLAWAVYALITWGFGYVRNDSLAGDPVLHRLAGLGAGAAAALRLMRWFKARDGRIFAYYLMHDYAFSAGLRGETPPQLSARLDAFRDKIAAALTEDYDEVLVVGHSSGAHLGASILADLIAQGQVPAGRRLGFLTLGQVVPMVSFLPRAQGLRRDLQALSVSEDVTWVDVSAPGDGCAFALCDPVAVSGVAVPGTRWPLVFSAAFTQTLSPDTWKRLRRRFFRLHFQYLCAFDRPKDYDYFQITAGPLSLAARYAGRAPSKSRIVTPVNKFTSVGP
ncbi:hypothetical protein E4Z66_03730 [Aliishimia ponticola]|uniref:Alpha/beta hydrolase n=1 Tax=Aliishimia ponticola TaxID=2499833 RepID=A0A4S4NR48_9RHOB|nr:hypothetical protein [Aliishimia ponticola]THH38690.1 hypothetical protein E4Z66_03730 [Aliishimia ponticola]